MHFVRWLLLFLLLAVVLCFALYALSGQVRFRRYGLLLLKWLLLAGFVFFGVLILQQSG